uniref:Putative metalloprotease n=1 Tax=Ixodes ricinus TaxID=34613 RepID=A0A0K8R925_IXORI
MGIFYDDGFSFLGVHALSRELAFLIGATRDNGTYKGCKIRDNYLTGPLDDSTIFRLSPCAEAAVQTFFDNKYYDNCWSDKPKPIIRNNWTLPSQYLEDNGRVDLCSAHIFYLEVKSCKKYSRYQRFHTCRVSCCDKDTNDSYGHVVEPDGKACGLSLRGNKMCIHGECILFSSP